MGIKNFTIHLENCTVIVYIKTDKKNIIHFVVKLEAIIDDEYVELCRYDMHHDCPHKDILDEHGNTVRKVFFETLTREQAIEVALKDFKENYRFYIERFTKWIRQ